MIEITVLPGSLLLRLADGREVQVPLSAYPKLRDARASDLRNWEVIGEGQGLKLAGPGGTRADLVSPEGPWGEGSAGMTTKRKLGISEARTRLFDLIDYVTSRDEGVVLIEHRDRKERAALVSESYLSYLERMVSEFRRHGSPFKLGGSAELLVGPSELERVLAEARAEAGVAAAEKFADV